HVISIEEWGRFPTALQDGSRRLIAAHHVHRSSHEYPPSMRPALGLIRIHLEGKLGIHVPAIVARAMRKLGAAALGASNVVNRLKRMMRTTFALARFAVFLDRKH